MSQRIINVDEKMLINLQVKVKIDSFSNHDGFADGQVEQAIEEFKSEIAKELKNKLADCYQMQEFIYSVDFVNYEIDL